MKVHVVLAESGLTDLAGVLLFDSVWPNRESAEQYTKAKFAQSEWASPVPEYEIIEIAMEG